VSVPVTGLIATHVIKAIQSIAGVDSRLSTAPSATVQGTVTSQTWTGGSGGGGNDLWSNGANWLSGTAPVAGDFVIFAGSTRLTPDMDIDSMSVGQILFNSGAGSFTIGSTGGKTLALAGNIIQNAANSQAISLSLSLGIPPTITNAGPLVISGEISGINGYTKTRAGTLTISGGSANLYSGGTTVSVGTLDVQKDGGLGSGNVTVASGAALKLGSGTMQTYIAPSANLLLQTGTPTVNLAFTGTDVINKLSFDGGTTFAAPGIWGAVGSGAANTSSRFTGTGLLQVQTSIWTGLGSDDNWSTAHNWTGDIAPNTSGDSVRFGGSTRTTPNMDNTYSVNSLVFDSTIGASFSITATAGKNLQIATAAGITNGSTFDHSIGADIAQGATALVVNTGTGGKQITLSGDVEGTGGYTVKGSGTLYLNNSANGIGGATLVNSGATLRLADFSDLGANDGVQALTLNGGTLQNDDTTTPDPMVYWATPTILGALGGTFNVMASTATELQYGDQVPGGVSYPHAGVALSGVGKLTKTGPGTLVMTNSTANTYQGGTLVQQGKLSVRAVNNLGSGAVTVASGATFGLTAPALFPSATNLLLQSGSPVVALPYTGANTVNKLSFDGGTTFALPGTWGAPGSGAANTDSRFTGTGLLNVTTGLVQPASTTISNIVGTTLSYGGGAGTRFVLLGTNNLAAPLANWTRLATNPATPGTFTIPAPGSASPRFYRVKSE
jgi:fibronectin-binding autotransporter adhesin